MAKTISALLVIIYPFVAAIAWMYSGVDVENWFVWSILNFTLLGVLPLLGGIVACKMYLDIGYLPLLLLSCGIASQGICYLVGTAITGKEINDTLTILNGGALLGSMFHLLAAGIGILKFKGHYLTSQSNRVKVAFVLVIFGGMIIISLIWIYLTTIGKTPVFFVQGQGGTLTRSFVLIAAALFYGISAGSFSYLYGQWKSNFHYWYILMLAMYCMTQIIFLVQTTIGDYLAWVGRGGMWLGAIFFAMAACSVLRSNWTTKMSTISKAISAFLSRKNGEATDNTFKMAMNLEFKRLREFKEKYGVLPHQAYIMFLEGNIHSLDDLTGSEKK